MSNKGQGQLLEVMKNKKTEPFSPQICSVTQHAEMLIFGGR